MNWDLNVVSRWRPPAKRPPSSLELEGMLRMLIIQDHMSELAIAMARLSEWRALSVEESQRQEEEFRRAMEEKNALFKKPKEEALAQARSKLGIDDSGRVQSHGDSDERKSLKQVVEFQKHVEKDLHRMTREALRQANKLRRDSGGKGDRERWRRARETYEILKSTFENVAGREFLSG